MRKLFLTTAGLALLGATAPVLAEHHAKDGTEMKHSSLSAILADERRADDQARDAYRNSAETLNFFGVKPGQTVVEYGPGGGWYTRVLLPYVAPKGQYVAIGADTASSTFPDRAREGRSKSWPERFPEVASGWTGVDAKKIFAYESDELPDEMKGTVDRIVIFRSLHGMMNRANADSELRNLRAMLKDDGMIGVVQHRANADAPFEMSKGTKGYLKQDNVVALFKMAGFELVSSSEINANPKDTKDYEGGVWTLPPILRHGETDRAKYQAIGESDRMTLLFKKLP
ncbi:hypothetical protein A8B75_15595 [Sphingomonadales bacterium EhC05]|nr:hypothetical protein A8B75_15595 [Sphingomonadales bacterium EhC05]